MFDHKIGTHSALFDFFAFKGKYHDRLLLVREISGVGIIDDIIALIYYII